MKYGKIIDGNLQIAGSVITNKDGGITTNPKAQQLIELGYKEIEYTDKPSYDINNQKLNEVYNEEENKIVVNYEIVELTDIEKLEIKKQQVIMLEQQYNMCRYQREIILAENSGASDYTKDKAQEIENLANSLRNNINNGEK